MWSEICSEAHIDLQVKDGWAHSDIGELSACDQRSIQRHTPTRQRSWARHMMLLVIAHIWSGSQKRKVTLPVEVSRVQYNAGEYAITVRECPEALDDLPVKGGRIHCDAGDYADVIAKISRSAY